MAINIQELSKDPVAWRRMVDEAFARSGATNQLAQGWQEAMYKLPEMLAKPLPTSASGVDSDTKRDWNEYYGQYKTSLADIQSAIAGGAKLEELGGGAKLMDWGYSNINQLLRERKGTETAGGYEATIAGQAPQSFADIRAGGDPNDLITIEKNGKQRQVSRSALSDSFATAGFKIVGEAGKQLQFGAEQAPSVPFISGLSGQQQDSINTLIGTGRAFNETDAKNFAYATGQADHKQFIGKTGQQAMGGLNKPKTALAETMGQPPSQITADMVAGEPVNLTGLFGGSSTSVQLSHILNIGGSSIDNAIMNFFVKQQELASKQLAIAEEQQAGLQEQLVGAMTTSTQDALNATLEQFQITQKMQALNDIKEQMLKKQEALSLGVQQEEDRIAPMTIIGRRQQKLRDQTAGELSALAVAGQVLQDDLTMAQALADMSFQAMQQDKQNQISAFEFLLSMNNQEVIRLRADEKESMNTQISLIREQIAKAEANQDQVFSMIASNPIAAQKGGVSFTDTREEALAKMTPFLGTETKPEKIGQDSQGRDIFYHNGEVVTGDKLLGVFDNDIPDIQAELFDPVAYDWATAIRDGQAKLSDLTGDPELKSRVVSIQNTLPPSDSAVKNAEDMIAKLRQIYDPETGKAHPGLNSAVGPTFLQRVPLADLRGAKDDFLALAEQLVSSEALNSLISAKKEGATFGALSDTEMAILRSAAIAFGGRLKDTGFDVTQDFFKKEITKFINDYQSLVDKAKDPLQLFSSSLNASSNVSGIRDGAKVSTIMGTGTATGIKSGSSAWSKGFDLVLSGGKGAPVKAPVSGKVVFAGKNGGFGNQVKIKTGDGKEIWISHLDAINVKPGQVITPNMIIGKQGNTGTVLSGTGQKLTRAQIASGRGTHLDITIKKPDGTYYTSQEVASMLGTKLV
uniref:Putative peptidase n=1 Tax=viral metagenome TaxID=1070528 RepID=A0A6H1ZSZ1_9ZZZZ